ncbi:AraC-like ligand-binding domain-containing protein [Kitasatospora indigofera]|uniref:AraC-like ligand-binding domain-containing protein n=1 Tax=Kitasatospora indigofera TaxID=67307 RepID=UPI00367CEBFA
MSLVLTTDSVPDESRPDYWRAAMSRAMVPMNVTPRAAPFTGRIVTNSLGYLRVCSVEAGAQRTSRTGTHIARSPEPYIAIGVQTRGTAALVQDNRHATAGERDLLVWDTSQPYSLTYPEPFAALIAHLPRQAVGLPDEQLKHVTGTVIDGSDGVGSALITLITSVITSAGTYPAGLGNKLAGSVVDLFTMLASEQVPPGTTDTETTNGHLLQRIRTHIDDHLGDPDLSPGTIARAHHISVRYLHRLFETEGISVGRLIKRRRLEEVARELARAGASGPTVSSVAHQWGFVNPAHFSREFRRQHGASPAVWRARLATHSPGTGRTLVSSAPDR